MAEIAEIPEDIPADVWEAALEPAEVAFDASVDLYETGISPVDVRLVIARAILAERLAERERCAQLVFNMGEEMGTRASTRHIASAIRNPLTNTEETK